MFCREWGPDARDCITSSAVCLCVGVCGCGCVCVGVCGWRDGRTDLSILRWSNTPSTGRYLRTFRLILPSGLQVQGIRLVKLLDAWSEGNAISETTEAVYQSTEHDVPEDLTFQQHRCENLSCRKIGLELRIVDWISYYCLITGICPLCSIRRWT